MATEDLRNTFAMRENQRIYSEVEILRMREKE